MSVRLWSLIIALILPPSKNQIFVPQKRRAGRVKSVTLPSPPISVRALLTNGGALTVVGFIRRGGATGKKSRGDCRSEQKFGFELVRGWDR